MHEKRKNKSVKVLYLKVLRSLSGAIESALLWYNLYSQTLVKMGFELNLYNKYVANKIINGKQSTMFFISMIIK